jgi:hypothetical protein|tara:strand:+ start:2070 stop:2588 length:519 start_codon:yes stop_codon:yes gene_type:complete
MLDIHKILRFTKKDLELHGKKIANAHKEQIKMGLDFEGKTFADYTKHYSKNKAAGKFKNQKSRQVNPPNLTLTGVMLSAFGYMRSAFTSGELGILYGIKDKTQALKLRDNQQGKFGRSRKGKNKLIRRPDKARVIVKNNKIGPDAEKAVVHMFFDVVRRNANKLKKRHVVNV